MIILILVTIAGLLLVGGVREYIDSRDRLIDPSPLTPSQIRRGNRYDYGVLLVAGVVFVVLLALDVLLGF